MATFWQQRLKVHSYSWFGDKPFHINCYNSPLKYFISQISPTLYTPTFQFSHRYICHTFDILQLWEVGPSERCIYTQSLAFVKSDIFHLNSV